MKRPTFNCACSDAAASTTAVYASSCTDEIDRIEAFISAQLGTALAEVQRLIGP